MSNSSIVHQLDHPLFKENKLSVYVKRDDMIHPIISGNKWRKLKFNVERAKKENYQGILSFGGAYSNHIHALAYACKLSQLESIGIIRGESFYQSNATLSDCTNWGMSLRFVDRATYQLRQNEDYLVSLAEKYPEHLIIPEGGTNALALTGVSEISSELKRQQAFDTIITPVGSAGTIAGLILGDQGKHQIIGIAVLKKAEYLNEQIAKLLSQHSCHQQNWRLLPQYHRGGYAKFSKNDVKSILEFSHTTNLPLEPIYSGKMVLALMELIRTGYFQPGHRIMLLHTGGLQGLAGLIERNKITAAEWPWLPA